MGSQRYKNKMEFVDDFSLKLERIGRPRIFGLILGWLIICDPPHQSFPDLMDNLSISKASVSNITRMLLETGLIEKVRITGERQVYFRIKEGSTTEFMERQMQIAVDFKEISKKALDLLENDKTDPQRLENMYKFHQFLSSELPVLIENFKKEHHV